MVSFSTTPRAWEYTVLKAVDADEVDLDVLGQLESCTIIQLTEFSQIPRLVFELVRGQCLRMKSSKIPAVDSLQHREGALSNQVRI